MLPKLTDRQRVFIEITNPTHGGAGWELGRRLWSPVFAKNNDGTQSRVKTWQIMERISQGDLIIHLVNLNDAYHFTGISITAGTAQQTFQEPPEPDQWGHMAPYQFVTLGDYFQFPRPEPITTFFANYRQELKRIGLQDPGGKFYVLYGVQQEVRMSQRYLAPCTEEIYKLFSLFAEDMGIDIKTEVSVTNTSDSDQAVGRVFVTTSRIIRDSALSKRIKREFQGRCQICGSSILMPDGNYYSEGHHIKPLGNKHNGPDVRENIIVVCPNHHAEFDFSSIAIDPDTLLIKHIDPSNPFHDQQLNYQRPELRKDLLEYHYGIFLAAILKEKSFS